MLGIARAAGLAAEIDSLVGKIQNELFALGAQLATPDPAAHQTALVGPRRNRRHWNRRSIGSNEDSSR